MMSWNILKSLFFVLAGLCLSAPAYAAKSDAYYALCREAVKDPYIFNNFKRHPAYSYAHEILPYEAGLKCLEYLNKHHPEWPIQIEVLHRIDSIGNPITFEYPGVGLFSPALLKTMKVAGDIQKQFPHIQTMHIVEIGGGCEGLCKILSQASGFASYTIVESQDSCELTRRYLEILQVQNVRVVSERQLAELPPCDLVISHAAYARMDKKQQQRFFNEMLSRAANGYIVMSPPSRLDKPTTLLPDKVMAQLYQAGKKGSLDREEPLLDTKNEVLMWKDTTSHIAKKPAPVLIPSPQPHSGAAVSYGFSGGRFGDNLISYLHAKWIAYKYGLPLLYRPFPYSDQLLMDNTSQRYEDFIFTAQQMFRTESDLTNFESSILYEIPYFPECLLEYEMLNLWWLPYFEVDWENPEFLAEVKEDLKPKQSIQTPDLPGNMLSICVHIRRGGNVDHPSQRFNLPLKFPPDSYYLTQIQRIATLFPDKKLYVFLMTDDLDPASIAQSYAKVLNNRNITIDYRAIGNSPSANVLEDFFSLAKFDCLIRCQSNFSLVGSLLGDYRIMITPKHAFLRENEIIIDQIELKFNPKGHL